MLEPLRRWWKGEDTPRGYVSGFYKAMQPFHQALCKKWYYNISMQYGNQWVEYTNGILKPITGPDWRVYSVNNKILPLSITQHQKLMPRNPTINTRPANMISEVDKKNSEIAGLLLRSKWKDNSFKDEVFEMCLNMVPCSVGYLLALWDGKDGRQIAPGVYLGEAKQVSASPFEIIPDYSINNFKEQTRFIRANVRSLDYIENRYGIRPPSQKLGPECMYQLKVQALLTGGDVNMDQALDDHALVLDMFELPNRKYPNGFHFVCTEDADLIKKEGDLNPYYKTGRYGEKKYFLPLDAAQMIRIVGALIGTNSVEQATPAQCCLNQGESVIQENIKRTGRTKYLAEEGSVAQGAMIDNPAEIIVEYAKDGKPPIPVKPPEMAQYHLNFVNSRPQVIEDNFGIHQATQGVLPRRATSGKAIDFLAGKDDERHFDPRQDIDRAISSNCRKLLCICANGYTEERIHDLIGDDNNIVEVTLKGEQLRSVDVTITRDTGLPESAADRWNLALEILKEKPSPEQLRLIFAIQKAQTIDDLEAILNGNSQAEELYAKMENYDMAKLIEMPVAPGEKHQMHIKTHQEIITMPGISDQVKMLVGKHIQDHQAQEGLENAQKMQQQLDAQATVDAVAPPQEPAGQEQQSPVPQQQSAAAAVPQLEDNVNPG